MASRTPASIWIALSLFGAIFFSLLGLVAGAVLFPREVQVEKPVEVPVERVVEKIVEKPVEKIIEKLVVAPAPPFSYKNPGGDLKSASEDEAKVALAVRDAIRVASEAKEMTYHIKAIMPTSRKVKLLVNTDARAEAETSWRDLKKEVSSVLAARGYVVLADDSSDQEWNTLLHFDVALVPVPLSGSKACVVRADIRQGMVAFSNGEWRKVNVIVASFAGNEIPFQGSLPSVLKAKAAEIAAALAAADEKR